MRDRGYAIQRIVGSRPGFYKVSFVPMRRDGSIEPSAHYPPSRWVLKGTVPEPVVNSWRDFRKARVQSENMLRTRTSGHDLLPASRQKSDIDHSKRHTDPMHLDIPPRNAAISSRREAATTRMPSPPPEPMTLAPQLPATTQKNPTTERKADFGNGQVQLPEAPPASAQLPEPPYPRDEITGIEDVEMPQLQETRAESLATPAPAPAPAPAPPEPTISSPEPATVPNTGIPQYISTTAAPGNVPKAVLPALATAPITQAVASPAPGYAPLASTGSPRVQTAGPTVPVVVTRTSSSGRPVIAAGASRTDTGTEFTNIIQERDRALRLLENTKDQFALVKKLYDTASNKVTEYSTRLYEAEAEVKRLNKVIESSLAAQRVFTTNGLKSAELERNMLKNQNALLMSQAHGTNAEVRRKAALWDAHEEREQEAENFRQQRIAKWEHQKATVGQTTADKPHGPALRPESVSTTDPVTIDDELAELAQEAAEAVVPSDELPTSRRSRRSRAPDTTQTAPNTSAQQAALLPVKARARPSPDMMPLPVQHTNPNDEHVQYSRHREPSPQF